LSVTSPSGCSGWGWPNKFNRTKGRGKTRGVDVIPLMRWGGVCPHQSLTAPLTGHVCIGGVRVAVGADGHQAALSGAVAAYGAAGPG
jgi:hypothetical protein